MKTFFYHIILFKCLNVLTVLEYTYLLNAPELVSAYNNAINIKINFTSNNMNSDKGLQYLKQYQILYKVILFP